jgi:hypothetical protein
VGDVIVTLSTAVDSRYRRPRYTIVAVSEPYAPPDGVLLRIDTCTRVKACVEMIVAAGCRPDLLVLFGIVHGREAETDHRRARAIDPRRRFGANLLVRPGNRDDLAPVVAQPLAPEPRQKPPNEVVHVGGLRVIGLHSTAPGDVHGELEDVQLDALADELAEPAADGTVLVVNHPPIPSITSTSDLPALREPERLSAVIRGSDVRLVLGGRTRPVSLGTLAGVPVWGSPSSHRDDDPLACSGFDGACWRWVHPHRHPRRRRYGRNVRPADSAARRAPTQFQLRRLVVTTPRRELRHQIDLASGALKMCSGRPPRVAQRQPRSGSNVVPDFFVRRGADQTLVPIPPRRGLCG